MRDQRLARCRSGPSGIDGNQPVAVDHSARVGPADIEPNEVGLCRPGLVLLQLGRGVTQYDSGSATAWNVAEPVVVADVVIDHDASPHSQAGRGAWTLIVRSLR